jgi:hypothetical protein
MILPYFLIATYLIFNSNLEFIDFKSYFLNLQTIRLQLGTSPRAIGCTPAGRSDDQGRWDDQGGRWCRGGCGCVCRVWRSDALRRQGCDAALSGTAGTV